MTFGKALELLKRGGIVKRRDWPETNWLIFLPGFTPIITAASRYSRLLAISGKTEMHLPILPRIDMHVDAGMQAGWLPNHEDMLAGDWEEEANV